MHVTTTVHIAIREAAVSGWSVCDAPLDVLTQMLEGYATAIPTRLGGKSLDRITASHRHETSLPGFSAYYGHERFPLHTDGAHLQNPPDLIFLEFEQPTQRAPTLLFHCDQNLLSPDTVRALKYGVFDIGFGRQARLGTALVEDRIRFDPIAMQPRDSLARDVVRFFQDCWQHADKYESPGATHTLVIDNRRTLHGRETVPADMTRSVRRLMVRLDNS